MNSRVTGIPGRAPFRPARRRGSALEAKWSITVPAEPPVGAAWRNAISMPGQLDRPSAAPSAQRRRRSARPEFLMDFDIADVQMPRGRTSRRPGSAARAGRQPASGATTRPQQSEELHGDIPSISEHHHIRRPGASPTRPFGLISRARSQTDRPAGTSEETAPPRAGRRSLCPRACAGSSSTARHRRRGSHAWSYPTTPSDVGHVLKMDVGNLAWPKRCRGLRAC